MTLLNKFENHLSTNIPQSSVTKFETIMACEDEEWGPFPVIFLVLAMIGLSVGVGVVFSSFIPGFVLFFGSLFASIQYATHCETKYKQQKHLSEKEKDNVLNMIKTLSLDPKYANMAKSYVTMFETEERRCFWDGFKILMKEYQSASQRKSVIEEINHNIEHAAQAQICIETASASVHASPQSLKV